MKMPGRTLKKYFSDLGQALSKGDLWTKLSLVVMGAGYFARKQIIQ